MRGEPSSVLPAREGNIRHESEAAGPEASLWAVSTSLESFGTGLLVLLTGGTECAEHLIAFERSAHFLVVRPVELAFDLVHA